LVSFLTFIGLVIRLSTPLTSIMPVNDGGLFYAMIQDVRSSHYVLPFFTNYNQAGIPFAYPPLGFYVYALIADITRIPLLDLVRILPAFISALAIPAFYLLAKDMLESESSSLIAVAAFTFMPRSFDWIIMGGGVTRALGFLFTLLALRQTYKLFTSKKPGGLMPAVIFSSLVAYTHPEATVHTVLASIFFYLWKDRSRKGAIQAVLVAAGVLALTSPWWATVIHRNGLSTLIAPMTAVGQDNINLAVRLLNFFIFQFTDEPLLDLFGTLALIGVFIMLARKQYFIPAWLFTMYMIEPRSAPLYMMAPLAMALGYGFEKIFLPGLNMSANSQETEGGLQESQLLGGWVVKLFLGFLFAYGVMSSFYVASQSLTKLTLTVQDKNAFQWVSTSTPTDSRFLIITQNNPLLDPESEWFPALTGRKNIGTVYGYEWLNDGLFGRRMDYARALQKCASLDVACLDAWQADSGENYSYVLVRKVKNGEIVNVPLIAYLQLSSGFEKVYEAETVAIFHKK